MADKETILAALAKLDHSDNGHWTDDGLPRTSVVQTLANDQSIKRVDINAASPGFARKVAGSEESGLEGNGGEKAASTETGGAPPVAAAEPGPGTGGEPMNEDEVRAVLNQRVVDAENALSAARAGVTAAQERVKVTADALTAAQLDRTRKFPPKTAAQAIKEHIASGFEQRLAATGRSPVSQIDLAMTRGNSRGWRRPRTPANAGTHGATVRPAVAARA